MTLDIMYLPIGEDRGFIHIPYEKLLQLSDLQNPPYVLESFKKETPESLGDIRYQIGTRLGKIFPHPEDHSRADALTYAIFLEGIEKFGGSLLMSRSPLELQLAVHVLSSAIIWGSVFAGYKWEKRKFRKWLNEYDSGFKKLRTPVEELFDVKVVEDLENIAENIKAQKTGGKAPEIQYLDPEYIEGIREMMNHAGGTLTPEAKIVYNLILAGYDGYITEPVKEE